MKIKVEYVDMRDFIIHILTKKWYIVLVIAIAILLRFYRLEDFATFLGDQGRDAIIIRRIATFEHFPAIGAPSSVGGVYLGPFYYYLVAPFLPLFMWNPVGLAFGVALFSTIGLIAAYYVIKREINEKTAFIFLILGSFMYILVDFARYSWNPNLLPFFAFFTLYFCVKTIEKDKWIFPFLLGAFLSFSIQLHYLAILLLAPIGIYIVKEIIQRKLFNKATAIKATITSFAFVLFTSPLILFDLKHDFLNSKNFMKLFTEEGVVSNSSLLYRLQEANNAIYEHVFQLDIPWGVTSLFSLILVVFMLILYKIKLNNRLLEINFYNFILYIIGFSFLSSPRYPHYYGQIYVSFLLVLAYGLGLLVLRNGWHEKKIATVRWPSDRSQAAVMSTLGIIMIIAFLTLNIRHYYFFGGNANKQIDRARRVGNFLASKVGDKSFNFATLPVNFQEDTFLYFMEVQGHPVKDRAKNEIGEQLIVLCEKEPCQVIDSQSWNISMFGKAKVDTIWKAEGLIIYKLVHAE